MSDEEKEAIEIVKGITEDDLLNYWEGAEEPYNAIQTILNLIENLIFKTETQKELLKYKTDKIEKQSKEIEELKEDIDKFKKALGKRITYCNELEKDLFENCSNYVVSKDKIKAKIEEYEKALNILLQKDEWIEPSDTIIRNKFMHYIEFGQSLLEKE